MTMEHSTVCGSSIPPIEVSQDLDLFCSPSSPPSAFNSHSLHLISDEPKWRRHMVQARSDRNHLPSCYPLEVSYSRVRRGRDLTSFAATRNLRLRKSPSFRKRIFGAGSPPLNRLPSRKYSFENPRGLMSPFEAHGFYSSSLSRLHRCCPYQHLTPIPEEGRLRLSSFERRRPPIAPPLPLSSPPFPCVTRFPPTKRVPFSSVHSNVHVPTEVTPGGNPTLHHPKKPRTECRSSLDFRQERNVSFFKKWKQVSPLRRWIGRQRTPNHTGLDLESQEEQNQKRHESQDGQECQQDQKIHDGDTAAEGNFWRIVTSSRVFSPVVRRWRTARRKGVAPLTNRFPRAGWLWRRVRWHLASSANAVVGCGLAAGKRTLSAAGLRAWENSKRLCVTVSEMADSTFHGIRKSLSSWSLSTVKRPKIITPKIKKSNLKKIFLNKRSNRAQQEDKKASDPETKAPFIDNADDSKNSKSQDSKECKNESNICVSVHKTNSNEKDIENTEEKRIDPHENISSKEENAGNVKTTCEVGSNEIPHVGPSVTDTDLLPNSLPGPGDNPHDESLDEEIVFIDDSPEEMTHGGDLPHCAVNLNISPEEYYAWFDAHGTPVQAGTEIPLSVEGEEEYSNYMASEYFDALDSRTITPASGKSYEDIEIPPNNIPRPSSAKAREWVKSFNEDASKRAEEMLKEEGQKQRKQQQQQQQQQQQRELGQEEQKIPRSRSEVELSSIKKKRSKKDEIVLNTETTQNNSTSKRLLQKLFSKEHKNPASKTSQENQSSNSTEVARKESIKKIFGVRGKLSLKTPIIDSKASTYKETDIYLASTPYALTNTLSKQLIEKEQTSKSSSETNEDGILETSLDPDEKKATGISEGTLDDSEELLKEIEMYLSDTSNTGENKKFPPIDSESKLLSDKSNVQIQETNVVESKEQDATNTHNEIYENHQICDAVATENVTSVGDTSRVQNQQNFPNQISVNPLDASLSGQARLSEGEMNSEKLESKPGKAMALESQSNVCISPEVQKSNVLNPDSEIKNDISTGSESKLNNATNITSKSEKNSDTGMKTESKRNSVIDFISEFKKNSAVNILSEFKRNSAVNPDYVTKRKSEIICPVNDDAQRTDLAEVSDSQKPPNESTTFASDANSKENQSTNSEERKRQKPGAYFSNKLKNIKESVLTTEFKEKLNLKEEKKKMKSFLSPLLPGNKLKGSEHEVPDNNCKTIVSESYLLDKNLYNFHASPSEARCTKQAVENSAGDLQIGENTSINKSFLENFNTEFLEDKVDKSVSKNNILEDSDGTDEVLLSACKMQEELKTPGSDSKICKDLSSIPPSQLEIKETALPEAEIVDEKVGEISEKEILGRECSKKIDDKDRNVECHSVTVTTSRDKSQETMHEIQSKEVLEALDTYNKNPFENEICVNDSYAKIDKRETKPKNELEENINMQFDNVTLNSKSICSEQNISLKVENLPMKKVSRGTSEVKPILPTVEVNRAKTKLVDDFAIYENEVMEHFDSKEKSSIDNSEIRKGTGDLNMKNTEKNDIKHISPVATCPKPIPRTRKSKFGQPYISDVSPKSSRNSYTEEMMILEEEVKTKECELTPVMNGNIQEKILVNNLEAAKPTNELGVKRKTTRDSGYGNSVVDENSGVTDPIYWEIGDNASSVNSPVPKPGLRKRKEQEQNSRSNQDLRTVSKGSLTKIPDWIQQRPPIPSPRGKKTKSTQSLVQGPFSSSGMDIPSVKVFGASFTNLNFEEPKERGDSKWAGEDFYSGKAASIAYGVTTSPQQPPEEVATTPPTLPMRTKKTSMTSLPGSIPVEEPCIVASKTELERFPRIFNKDMSQKRLRRRTSPAEVPPKAAPRRVLKLPPQLTPRQALLQGLQPFMENGTMMEGGTIRIMKSITTEQKRRKSLNSRKTSKQQPINKNSLYLKAEDMLADTLFSVNSIMGQDIGGTWGADTKNGSKGGGSVTLGQVRAHLKSAFQVSSETFDDILENVRKREAANVTLTLKILEASDLRAKTVRGASNPYVTIEIPGTEQNYRTRTEHETLSPKWKEEFKLKVKNLNQDLVKLEVWHDFDPNLTSQMLAVKDLKSFSRLIKGTTAIAHKHEHHLLGTVTVPLKDIRESGVNKWFQIQKEPFRDAGKQRGSLHIDAYVTATTQSISLAEAQRSHDALLARLIYHHIKTATNNNTEEDNVHIPWHGQLSPEANAAVAQHAIILGLTPSLQNLSWWIVGSRVPTVDAGWLLNQLKIVQKHLEDGLYDCTAIESLADSFAIWIENNIQKLRTLRKSFLPHSGVIAKHQFASTVSTFVALESHKQSFALLERKEMKDLKTEVKEAIMIYMKIWWSEMLEQHLKGETRIEIQIQKIVIITSEMYNFLCEIQSFYSPILLKEMNIKLFREMFLLATKKLNPCVRPPIMNMYKHLERVSETQSDDEDVNKPSYTLEDGSNLWQLYVNLGRINKLGVDLPPEIRKESGIYEYHKWFNKGVRRWVELARRRALQMIERAVELDNLEHVDEYCNFSSSATDVSGIFTDVQIWWHKLEWPDPENSTILLAKILEDVCSYAMRYADLLKQKVEGLFSEQSNTDQLVISQQICTGLNNIERIRDELTRLPDVFGVRFLSEKVKHSQSGGEDASTRFSNNVKTLIEHSSENMEGKVVEFIEAVIEKMTRTLHDAVIQACEASSQKYLLQDVLDPAIQLLHEKMSENNFKRFMQRLWEGLVHLFNITVTRNADKRKPSYFNGVYQILESSLKFFSPSDGAGLDRNEARSQAYVDLLDLLECLRLTTDNLISRYYTERYEEQKLATNRTKAELVVRAYFTKGGKLCIEVIMAKDMHLGIESRITPGGSGHQIDSYVKMQCVPSDWFPNIHEARTKTMRKCNPAVFEENFEFELKHEDDGISAGYILFTLKEYNLGRSNTFIGEALIPLNELECVDSSCVHGIQNTYLKMTQPSQESGYQSLRALAFRPGDRIACAFLKKIQTRVHGLKLKVSVSSDEEKQDKPKIPRSPRLLRKIMNN